MAYFTTNINRLALSLLLSIFFSFSIISCSDSVTDTGSEDEPPQIVSGFPMDELSNNELPIVIHIVTGDIYTDADEPVFGTAVSFSLHNKESDKPDGFHTTQGGVTVTVNGEDIITVLEEFCMDSVCQAVQFEILNETVSYGESVNLSVTYEGQTHSQTLTMPYLPQLNLPGSFHNGNESTISWSIQENPALFWIDFFYDIYIDGDATGSNVSPALDGGERSYKVEEAIVEETLEGDRWLVTLHAADFEYWNDDGVLLTALTGDTYEHEESTGQSRFKDNRQSLQKGFSLIQ